MAHAPSQAARNMAHIVLEFPSYGDRRMMAEPHRQKRGANQVRQAGAQLDAYPLFARSHPGLARRRARNGALGSAGAGDAPAPNNHRFVRNITRPTLTAF